MTDREHLAFTVRLALSRLPKAWLRELQKPRPDELVREMVANAIVEQIELGNIRYHLGPPGPAPTTRFGGKPRE